jgi:hypothetical protein
MLVEVLKQCEDNLSRPNIMAQATQLHALAPHAAARNNGEHHSHRILAAQAIAHEI